MRPEEYRYYEEAGLALRIVVTVVAIAGVSGAVLIKAALTGGLGV